MSAFKRLIDMNLNKNSNLSVVAEFFSDAYRMCVSWLALCVLGPQVVSRCCPEQVAAV